MLRQHRPRERARRPSRRGRDRSAANGRSRRSPGRPRGDVRRSRPRARPRGRRRRGSTVRPPARTGRFGVPTRDPGLAEQPVAEPLRRGPRLVAGVEQVRAGAAGCPGAPTCSSKALHRSASEAARVRRTWSIASVPWSHRSSAVSAGVVIRSPRCSRTSSSGIFRVSSRNPGWEPRRRPPRPTAATGTDGQNVSRAAAAPVSTPSGHHALSAATRLGSRRSVLRLRRRRAGRWRARPVLTIASTLPRRPGCARRATTPSRRTTTRTSSCSFVIGPSKPDAAARRPRRRAVHRVDATDNTRAGSRRVSDPRGSGPGSCRPGRRSRG